MSNNKLVIVDDDEILLRQFKSFLERKGYIVFTAVRGEDAIELLKKEDADLMILDLHLTEGMQGMDVFRRALEFKPGLKVAIHSGIGHDKDAVDMCLNMGAKMVLSKPMALSAVKEELDKLQVT
jgi:DNA-binding response OmpR family regulator